MLNKEMKLMHENDPTLQQYMQARFGKIGLELMESTSERFQKPAGLEVAFCWLACIGCTMKQCELGAVLLTRGLSTKALGEVFQLKPAAIKNIFRQMSDAVSIAGKVNPENLEGLTFREKLFFRWSEYLSHLCFVTGIQMQEGEDIDEPKNNAGVFVQ